ncbi:hypothetical protein [Pseudarthrobacter sp. BIM B-2242]|uniref:hypothetical protein n=1 Tax=Pseudarthrobacter sp. BIM B-2242 TaxID=2772401 RepID=UPI00168BA39E|nr:hypothetical protein [Pseudarthrobacter sp. BIM B-2242]QOD03616.1 hypothetical protein IDT60_00390 [Pseudarthrobacter sp. BIM B-2242]
MQTENSTCTDFHEHERTQHDSITIHVHTRSHLEAGVEAAVQELAAYARYRKQGILVTRTAPGTVIVSLDPNVPYGMSYERTTW